MYQYTSIIDTLVALSAEILSTQLAVGHVIFRRDVGLALLVFIITYIFLIEKLLVLLSI